MIVKMITIMMTRFKRVVSTDRRTLKGKTINLSNEITSSLVDGSFVIFVKLVRFTRLENAEVEFIV